MGKNWCDFRILHPQKHRRFFATKWSKNFVDLCNLYDLFYHFKLIIVWIIIIWRILYYIWNNFQLSWHQNVLNYLRRHNSSVRCLHISLKHNIWKQLAALCVKPFLIFIYNKIHWTVHSLFYTYSFLNIIWNWIIYLYTTGACMLIFCWISCIKRKCKDISCSYALNIATKNDFLMLEAYRNILLKKCYEMKHFQA